MNRQPNGNITTAGSKWLGLWREFGVLADSFRPEPWAAVSYRFDKNGALSWYWKPQIFGLEDNGSPGPRYHEFRRARDAFQELAVQAGVECGAAPVPTDDPDSWLRLDARDFWLHRVFADLLGLPPGNMSEQDGCVENVCEVCAAFCSRLQAKAFAAENAALPAQPQVLRAGSAEAKTGEPPPPLPLPNGSGTAQTNQTSCFTLTSPATKTEGRAADRRAAVDSYIAEILEKTGRKITRVEFWESAGYSDATEFERWQRDDSKANAAADQNFKRVLETKPHLKPQK